MFFYLDEEVASEEEEIDDNGIDDAAEDIVADNALAAGDIEHATMLPKVKPIPKKAAPKKESAAATANPSPPDTAAATAVTCFSVDAGPRPPHDPLLGRRSL